MKKPMPPTLFYTSIAVMLALRWTLPIRRLLSFPWTLAGAGLLVAGLWVCVWADRVFREVGTTVKPFDEPGVLVTAGPFRVSRHPMYLGFVAALLGISVLLGAVSPFLVALVFFLLTDRWYIAFEERAMRSKFGETYEQYRRKTRRWL